MVSTQTHTITKYLGTKRIGTNTDQTAENTKIMGKYTIDDTATISDLSVRGGNWQAGKTNNVKGFIYSDVAGVPTTLLATTEEYVNTVQSGSALMTLPFTNPVTLDAGTYWFGFFFETPVGADDMVFMHATGGDTNQWASKTDAYADGPSDPCGAPDSYQNWKLIIYAAYTTSTNMRYPPSVEGNTVTTTACDDAIAWQEKTFQAAGRTWVFYIDGAPGNWYGYYTSSTDLTTWETPVSCGASAEGHGANLQAILDDDGYVHVIRRIVQNLYYRRGLPNSDGTITWTAADTVAWNTGSAANVDFYAVIDSYGYPWIMWGYGADIDTIKEYITKSSNNNGIWATEGGYPVHLNTVGWNGGGESNNFLLALPNGKLYAFYFKAPGVIKGRYWNGVVWAAEENCTTSEIMAQYPAGYETWSRGAVVDDDGNIHLVFLKYRLTLGYAAFSWPIIYVKYTYGTGWGSETELVADNLWKSASPSIAKVGDTFYVFWNGEPSPNCIFCKKLSPQGNWSSSIYLVEELTDTITYANTYGYDGVINPFVKLFDNKVGLLWLSGSSSPYNIRFAIVASLRDVGLVPKTYTIDNTLFNKVINVFSRIRGNPDFEVTLSSLSLGDADSITGWYSLDYTDSTINMIIITQDAPQQETQMGYYVKLDALGLTNSQVEVYDLITDKSGHTWLVKSVNPQRIGDIVQMFKCDLSEMPLFE